ncbi:MAG: TolC family protein, partial [Gemmatimonadota bacterium]|nr:TolC family protein [Gemmatimonadota bacterium]
RFFISMALGALALGRPAGSAAQELTPDEALRRALESHPSLAAARARVESADEGAATARAARLPGVSLSTSLTRFEEPMIVFPLHRLDLSEPPSFDRTLVQGRAGFTYTVFDAGERSSRIDGAGAAAEATAYGLAITEMTLTEAVLTAYVGTLSARAVADAAAARVRAVEQEVARTEQSLQAGTVAEVDVLRARAALQDARAGEATATARVGLAERSLARVTGVPLDEMRNRALTDVAISGAGSDGVDARSPTIERARRMVAAAESTVREQRAGRLPELRASAAILDFGTLSGDHVLEWQAGVQLSWSVFNGGARSAAIRRADADLRAARSELDLAELNVAAEEDAADAAITEADARAEALEAAVRQWTEVARIEALALDVGSGVQSDLLRAQASLFNAQAGYARARYDAVLARVSRARAQGVLDIQWVEEALEIQR